MIDGHNIFWMPAQHDDPDYMLSADTLYRRQQEEFERARTSIDPFPQYYPNVNSYDCRDF